METVISVRCNKTTQIFSSLSTTSQLPCPITFSFETGTSQIPHLTLTRVLEGSPLTLTLSQIHTLNVVVSQTACLRLWPEKTTHVCLIMRLPYSDPVGSAHTQCCTCEVPDLFVTSNRSIGMPDTVAAPPNNVVMQGRIASYSYLVHLQLPCTYIS